MKMKGGVGVNDGSRSKANADSNQVVKESVTGAPVEVKNGAEQRVESETRVSEGATPIAPITPLPVKEVRDIRAPRAVVPRRLSEIDVENSEESECSSPCTPKQGVFDPFAPGPEDMCLAPKLRKKTGESRVSVARQLDFASSSSSESGGIVGNSSSDEEKMLESVCGDILEVIVPASTELYEAEHVAPDKESDGFKTPPRPVPYLNGTANKCPDAPMKQGKTASKRLQIDASLCRKLEF